MKTVKIIAYGTLMTGEHNHRFFANAVRIEPCTIKGTLYDLHCGFPALTTDGDTEVHAKLAEIPFEDWSHVDCLEGYPTPASTTASSFRPRLQTAASRRAGCTS